jgi:hypothetical protein
MCVAPGSAHAHQRVGWCSALHQAAPWPPLRHELTRRQHAHARTQATHTPHTCTCTRTRTRTCTGVALGEACTIVLRGASTHILEEADRSLHDALCVLSETVSAACWLAHVACAFGVGCVCVLGGGHPRGGACRSLRDAQCVLSKMVSWGSGRLFVVLNVVGAGVCCWTASDAPRPVHCHRHSRPHPPTRDAQRTTLTHHTSHTNHTHHTHHTHISHTSTHTTHITHITHIRSRSRACCMAAAGPRCAWRARSTRRPRGRQVRRARAGTARARRARSAGAWWQACAHTCGPAAAPRTAAAWGVWHTKRTHTHALAALCPPSPWNRQEEPGDGGVCARAAPAADHHRGQRGPGQRGCARAFVRRRLDDTCTWLQPHAPHTQLCVCVCAPPTDVRSARRTQRVHRRAAGHSMSRTTLRATPPPLPRPPLPRHHCARRHRGDAARRARRRPPAQPHGRGRARGRRGQHGGAGHL